MPAKRHHHRTVEDRLRVGGGLTVTVNPPCLPAPLFPPVDGVGSLPCRRTGGHVEDKRGFSSRGQPNAIGLVPKAAASRLREQPAWLGVVASATSPPP